MKTSKVVVTLAVALLGAVWARGAYADTLNTADAFAVLAGSAVTNAGAGVLGATVITGDLGVSPGAACSGFGTCPVTGPGTINGAVSLGNAVALQAQSDLTTAFTNLAILGAAGTLVPGGVLNTFNGGNFTPGVYFAPSASLTGTITLSDGGVAGSQFIFFTGAAGALNTATNSVVDVSGLSPTDSVFWVVGSSATLGVNTVFQGNVLASTSITLDPGATIGCGRALAENGAVSFAGQDATSLIENQVSIACAGTSGAGGNGFGGGGPSGSPTPTPEPGTLPLAGCGLFFLIALTKRG